MDFVAIEPYVSLTVLPLLYSLVDRCLVHRLGSGWDWYQPIESIQIPLLTVIGQRYHVIVEAKPSNDLIPVEDQNYWIRITGARGCFDVEPGQDNEKLGIIRYNAGSKKTPTSTRYNFNTDCADEPYESLVPVVPMEVTARDRPANDSWSPCFPYHCAKLTGNPTHSPPRHGRQL